MLQRLPTSPRLRYDALGLGDADFIVELLNDADFRRHIGDRGVRAVGDVAAYLSQGPWDSYQKHGFGLLKLTARDAACAVGIAGLIRRPTLNDVDLGYALLPAHRGKGYATEACRALIRQARDEFELTRLVAIVSPDNAPSIRTLEGVGFRHEETLTLTGQTTPVHRYGIAP